VKRPTPELLDISCWPSVDVNALEEEARLRYQQRAAAVEHYAAGAPLGEIESQTEIHRRVLYRMIERALQAHPDGRPWGFRALVPGSHTKAYERRKASKSAGVGLAGAFNQLLDRQPKLEELVRQLIASCDIRLVQKGERVYLKNLRNAHNRFMAACRSLGLEIIGFGEQRNRKSG
jgi:putative transposase